MIKKTVLCLFIFISILSCNNENKESATADTDTLKEPEMKIMIPTSGCYEGVSGKDSFFLKTEIFPNVVTGTLDYNFYEKDDNKGEIDGVLKGDTLFANYSFMSEGTKSVREVAFLLKNNEAIEGYGEMEAIGDTMKFKNRAGLDFSKGIRMAKIDCVGR